MTFLATENLTKTYGEGAQTILALENINFAIHQGEFVVLSGPSGSGKSTLLHLLGALDQPTSGDVLIGGKRLSGMSALEKSQLRRDRLGFVFQAYNLVPVMTAIENAEFVLKLKGLAKKEARSIAAEALEAVGLAGMEDRLPHELSGGQQQRVAIARAIATKPELVIADEPTANLDREAAANLMNILNELNQSRGITIVMSSHDDRVLTKVPREILLEDGVVKSDQSRRSS